jgi:imidazolonepropionase-like amidohydrolase
MLGIERWTGSLDVGKDADLALFTHHPLDVYTRVSHTWIDGELVFDLDSEGSPHAWP